MQEVVAQRTQQIGEQAGKVRVLNTDWSVFIQEGVLVALHVHRYRAKVGVTLDDLGIAPESREEREALLRTLDLGQRLLLPKEVILRSQEIEGRCRQWLVKNSFKTVWGQFIHVSRYQVWREQHLKIVEQYLELADEIERTFPTLLAQVRNDYTAIGNQVYERVKASTTLERSAWVDAFVNRAVAGLPTARSIRDSFQITYDVKVIPPQAAVIADRLEGERLVMEARAKAQLRAREQMDADLQLTQAREAAGGIQQFVEDIQAQIRGEIYDTVIAALEALRNDQGRMPRGTTQRIKTMCDMVTNLVFWDDKDLKRKVDDLRDLCEVTAAQRDVDAVERSLRQLGNEARLVLLEIQRQPERSLRALEEGQAQPAPSSTTPAVTPMASPRRLTLMSADETEERLAITRTGRRLLREEME